MNRLHFELPAQQFSPGHEHGGASAAGAPCHRPPCPRARVFRPARQLLHQHVLWRCAPESLRTLLISDRARSMVTLQVVPVIYASRAPLPRHRCVPIRFNAWIVALSDSERAFPSAIELAVFLLPIMRLMRLLECPEWRRDEQPSVPGGRRLWNVHPVERHSRHHHWNSCPHHR